MPESDQAMRVVIECSYCKWRSNRGLCLMDAAEGSDYCIRVANESSTARQVGGAHYVKHAIQPWDIIREYGLNFWEGNALKYLLRRKGSRVDDLEKCRHYIDYLIERERAQ